MASLSRNARGKGLLSFHSVAAMKAVQIAATMKSDHVLKNPKRRLEPPMGASRSSRAWSDVDMAKFLCAAAVTANAT